MLFILNTNEMFILSIYVKCMQEKYMKGKKNGKHLYSMQDNIEQLDGMAYTHR